MAGVDDALYEIRRLASGSNEIPPPEGESTGTSAGGVISYLSLQGVSKLRKRWSRNNTLGCSKRRSRTNAAFLLISRNAEYVGVVIGNHITVLRKGGGYASTCGVYTNNDRMSFFTNGAWLEAQGILGVVDDLNTFHLIKENGEALTRRTSNQLKLSYPIIDIVAHDGSSSERPGFYIFTSDGMVHKFDCTHDHEANLQKVSILIKDVVSAKTPQLPHSLSCVDYHQDHLLMVLVGNPNALLSSNGSSGALYMLHFNRNLEFSLSFPSLQLEGTFFAPKDQTTFVSSAKVRISPHSKHIATLDLNGSVNILVLANDKYSASLHSPRNGTQLIGVKDISWWTDNILMVVKENGSISMYSITGNMVVSEYDPLSTPQLEKARFIEGYTFILQSSRYERNTTSEKEVDSDSKPSLHNVSRSNQHSEMDKIFWSLVSFSKITVPEKYSILIRDNQYKEALDFACQHNLDKDEVLKAPWLCSDGDVIFLSWPLAEVFS